MAQGTPSTCAAHAAARPALPPDAQTTRIVGPCVARARCMKCEMPRYLYECDGWRFLCCVTVRLPCSTCGPSTHLKFEVDGVVVSPETRGEMAGEDKWSFRPQMALALLDRHCMWSELRRILRCVDSSKKNRRRWDRMQKRT